MDNITGSTVTNLFEEPIEESSRASPVYRVFLALLISLVCVFGVVGNCLVAFAIARYPNLRTVTNYLIISLAVADTTVCAWVMPVAAYQDLSGGVWRLGDALCDFWVGSDVLMSTASIWNLCAVSVDRYLAISRPIWYATKRKLTFAFELIFIAWSLSFVVSVMALFIVGGFQGNENSEFCAVNTQPSFGITASLVSFFIPACAILLLYALILRSAMRLTSHVRPIHTNPDQPSQSVEFTTRYTFNSNKQNIVTKGSVAIVNTTECGESNDRTHDNVVPHENAGNYTSGTTSDDKQTSGPMKTVSFQVHSSTMKYNKTPAPASSDQGPSQPSVMTGPTGGTSEEGESKGRRKRVKVSMTRERRAAVVIGVVVLAFIACWLPFFAVFLVLSSCTTCTVSLEIFQFVTWLGWCNSALNPVIYTAFNREFRQAFQKMFSCKNS